MPDLSQAARRQVSFPVPVSLAPRELTDAELLARVAGGDLLPLGVLYDRHHNSVRQFVARATSNSPETDDLTQETFLTLSSIADRYDGRASARPLLVGIAARLVKQRRRGIARVLRVLAAFGTAEVEPRVRTPEEQASTSEQMRRFESALARLTDEKRLVVLLVDREGVSGEEASRILGVPLNTVWTRLHYGRAELRKALGHER
jgi:RNA polymerase sigma-70 factor (ECF subfamily)